jgi:hypothetical protein
MDSEVEWIYMTQDGFQLLDFMLEMFNTFPAVDEIYREISSSHAGEYEGDSFLGCSAV